MASGVLPGTGDRQPGGLVEPRGVPGTPFGDLHRRGSEPWAEALVGPQLGQDVLLEQVAGEQRLHPLDGGAAERQLEGGLAFGGLDAPDPGRIVDAPRGDLAAVAADGQADDAAGMAAERQDGLARPQVPELDGPVVAGGGQAPAVGEIRHAGDQGGMAVEGGRPRGCSAQSQILTSAGIGP